MALHEDGFPSLVRFIRSRGGSIPVLNVSRAATTTRKHNAESGQKPQNIHHSTPKVSGSRVRHVGLNGSLAGIRYGHRRLNHESFANRIRS